MRLGNLILVVLILMGIAVLCTLGMWQMQRLAWKEDLIATVEARIKQAPKPLMEILEQDQTQDELNYLPVTITGEFDHSKEVYYFNTNEKGRSGWEVYTPLKLDSGKTLIVNRGFVPYEMKDPKTRQEGLIEGQQSFTGLVRLPLESKPTGSVDNTLEKREFFWRSLPDMVGLMQGDDGDEFVNVFVDMEDAPVPGGWPKGGATRVSFSNNHLQYAITWFGLALTLILVGGAFLYQRRSVK